MSRDPFTQWTGTKEGAAAIARVAEAIRFSLLGRTRAARRRVWRALRDAARDPSLATGIQAEAAHYMAIPASLSYSQSLPRAHVALHRLVLVPRAMIAGRARGPLFERLRQAPALAGLDDAVRDFFLDQLLIEMDGALQQASPSPRRPVQANGEWTCVGAAKELVWVDPLWSGRDATGHVFMYEFPRSEMSRRDRKTLEAAVAELAARVSRSSRAERSEMVRMAC